MMQQVPDATKPTIAPDRMADFMIVVRCSDERSRRGDQEFGDTSCWNGSSRQLRIPATQTGIEMVPAAR